MSRPRPRLGFIRRLLDAGGRSQFVYAVLGTIGINGATALGVAKVIAPKTFWEYVFVVCIFLAVTPVSFPLSALALTSMLTKAELRRRRDLFEDPIETAKRRIDRMLADGRVIQSNLPRGIANRNESAYHEDRVSHWLRDTDALLVREAGQYASHCFMIDEREDAWSMTRKEAMPWARERMELGLRQLERVRDELPIDRKHWLRIALSDDIKAGRALVRHLNQTPTPQTGDGIMELAFWVDGIYATLRDDASEYAHLFTADTYQHFTKAEERADYVEKQINELERIWAAV